MAVKIRQYRHHVSRWHPVHPFAVWHVDPETIDRYVTNVFQKFPNTSKAVGGEWDRTADPLSSSGKYSLLKQFYDGEIPADDLTPDVLRAHGYNEHAAQTYSEMGYGEYLETLRESIEEHGFQSVEQLADRPPGTGKYDCVTVNVSRDGEILFAGNGFHRLVIAKTAGLKSLPVRVKVVHEQWAKSHRDLRVHPELSYVSKIPFSVTEAIRLDLQEVRDANTGYFPEK
jgi:hypothetical protein